MANYVAEKNAGNARYWTATLYPENMIDGWENEVDDLLGGIAYAYCIHDKDHLAEWKPGKTTPGLEKETYRKHHVHFILAFTNTTTVNHARNLFMRLAKPGCQPIAQNGKVEAVVFIRYAYEYLIHNTESSRKQKKYQYDPAERHTGNGFDIGIYEQISLADKHKMLEELTDIVVHKYKFTNFVDLTSYVYENMDGAYRELLISYASYLEKLTKGNYQKAQLSTPVDIDAMKHDITMDILQRLGYGEEE